MGRMDLIIPLLVADYWVLNIANPVGLTWYRNSNFLGTKVCYDSLT